MNETVKLRYDRVPEPLYWRAAGAACAPLDGRWGAVKMWVGILAVCAVALFLISLLNQLPIIQQGGFAFLAGLTVMWLSLIAIGRVNRARMSRILTHEQSRRGPTEAVVGPDGIIFTSGFGVTEVRWHAIDRILDLKTGTGLRIGLMVYPIPNDALPGDLTPAEFRSRAEGWKEAAV